MSTLQVSYKEFKENNSKELQDFISKNCFWAFGEKQFEKKLCELDITHEEFEDTYCSFMGGAMRKDKVQEYKRIAERMNKNMRNMLLENFEFAKSAFMYEMNNYECFIADNWDKVRSALGLSLKDINSNPTLLKAWNEARKEYYNKCLEMC